MSVQPQQQRARERREAIVRAAAAIAAKDGFGAVSHRSVARRAGVPLGSTTYYFASLDDLLGAVAGRLVDECLERGAALLQAATQGPYPPRAAADLVTRAVLPGDERDRVLSYYEQLLGSARHPAVAAALSAARPRLVAMIERALVTTGRADSISADLTLAVVDGAAMSALSEGHQDVVGFVIDVATELMERTPHARP